MSNKTPLAPAKKTASARNLKVQLVVAVLVSVLVGLVFVARQQTSYNFGSQKVHYTRAVTEDARTKGLSGRATLPADEAMLFVFQTPGTHCFWMKDMQFPIDMVWLDTNKKIIKIESDVQPSSYPHTFCPDGSALYVVEVDAGQAKQAGLATGQHLQF